MAVGREFSGRSSLVRGGRTAHACAVFVAEDVPLPLDYAAARARLLAQLRIDGLQASSSDAFEEGQEQLLRAGVGAVSKEVLVQLLRPYEHDGVLVVPVRWVATGTSGALFPQLDGNLELRAEDDASILGLQGSYRPPLSAVGGALDRLLLNRVAGATVRRFLAEIAMELVALPESAVDTGGDSPDPRTPAWAHE